MSMSSLFVVTNALRLNLFNIYDSSRDKMTKENISINAIEYGASNDAALEYEGGSTMTKTVNIEGMMCAHCEANVKKALEALDGIESAVVSHEAGTAVIELSKEVDDDLIKQTIEDKDYKFISIG